MYNFFENLEYLEKAKKRFWKKVTKTESCWLFKPINMHGYGVFSFKGKSISAHRFSFLIHHGCIVKNLVICHICDNPACVNPDHLCLDTHQGNIIDSVNKGRFKKIKNGKYIKTKSA